jgi:hypothetical protein
MKHSLNLAPLLLVSVFATSSPAQDRAPSPPIDRVHGIDHSVMHYQTQAGSLWARGQQYKVSFDAAGATYIPVFGKRQPHNVPHALSPDLVTLGGETLSFEHAAPAVRDGDRVEIDRGAFIEAYDLTPQALEQTFVFSSLPRGGDLVLHIPVSSEFEGVESAAGFEFRGEFGQVTFGRATAVDARGRRQTADMKLENGAITIELDASFLATAALPLVIDPVVSTFVINGWSNSNDYYSDAAYDPTYHQWLVVFEENNSGADSDVFVTVLDDAGSVGGGFYLDLSSDSWESVHCADNAQAHQWLIVATVISGPSQTIQGFQFDSAIPGGHQFLIANYLFNPPVFPVVGGDPAIGSGPTRCCVAYARAFSATDWNIEAVLVDPNGNVSSEIGLSTSFNTIDTSPAISKSNDHNEWMIAWQRNNGTSNLADIWGGRIRRDGVVTAPPFQITNYPREERSPSVSSPLHGTLRFLVAWQAVATTSGLHDIVASLIEGSTLLDTIDLYYSDESSIDEVSPSVDSDGQHFLVSRSDGIPQSFDILVTDLYVLGNTLGVAQHAVQLSSGSDSDNSRVVSAASSGSSDPSLKHRFLVTWNSGPPGGWADINGGLVDTIEGGGTTPFCFGDELFLCPCGPPGATGHGCRNSVNPQGALLTASGYSSPSNDSLVLRVEGVPATALCVFFQGTAPVLPTVFGDGIRCVGGSLIRLRTVPASGGAVSIPRPGDPPISTLGAVPPSGGTRYHQVWYRDPASFCTPATYNISNGMIVVWAP